MKLNLNLTKEDTINFQLFILTLSKQIKKTKLSMWMFGAILNLLIYVIISEIFHKYIFSTFVVISGVSIFWLAAYPFYWQYVMKKRIKKFLRERQDNETNEHTVIDFKKKNILIEAKTNQFTINYNTLYSLVETSQYFYLFLNNYSAIIIPKKALSEKEKINFLSIIQKWGIRFVNNTSWKWSFFAKGTN